jgi:hypothetical protein
MPTILAISEGLSFNSVSEEYEDAKKMQQIDELSDALGGVIPEYYYYQWVSLTIKYGIKPGIV